ncbi:MAG TPA: hypothetical protein VFP72_12955 [Kineosporiaceae bacterium]|nr:hypothetical protein [Kineosporiaceae bacterium]
MPEVVQVHVDETLIDGRELIIDQALRALECSQAVHYAAAGQPVTRQRLTDLFDLVVTALRERDLTPVAEAAQDIARQRFHAGFDIGEVQTAFNALEEAMWRQVVAALPPDRLAEGIGLLGTVLGAGKDALARTYVELAAQRRVPSLDLSALFQGQTS